MEKRRLQPAGVARRLVEQLPTVVAFGVPYRVRHRRSRQRPWVSVGALSAQDSLTFFLYSFSLLIFARDSACFFYRAKRGAINFMDRPTPKLPEAVQDCHDALAWLIPQLDKFPRQRRFTLGQKLEERLLDILALRPIVARACSLG